MQPQPQATGRHGKSRTQGISQALRLVGGDGVGVVDDDGEVDDGHGGWGLAIRFSGGASRRPLQAVGRQLRLGAAVLPCKKRAKHQRCRETRREIANITTNRDGGDSASESDDHRCAGKAQEPSAFPTHSKAPHCCCPRPWRSAAARSAVTCIALLGGTCTKHRRGMSIPAAGDPQRVDAATTHDTARVHRAP